MSELCLITALRVCTLVLFIIICCLFVLDSMPVIVGVYSCLVSMIMPDGHKSIHSLKKTSFLCGIINIVCV